MTLENEPGESRRALEWLAVVMDNVSAVVFVRDAEGRYLLVNKHCANLTGRTPEEMIGKTLFDFIPREEAQAVYADDLEVMRSGRPMRFEEKVTLPGGEHVFLANKTPLYDAGGTEAYGICGVSTDITEMKELEQRAYQAQKLEAVGQLAGGIAHGFNNLLQIILGAADHLRGAWPGAPPPQEVDDILDASRRGARLVRQLLDYSRTGVTRPEVLDLNELIQDAKEILRATVTEEVELILKLDPELHPTEIDPTQVEQILLNLALNARGAMPEGGSLLIETGNCFVDDEFGLRHGHMNPGAYVCLTVSDTGSGMDEKVQEHIFEPFFSTQPRAQASGMGLSTVYGIIQGVGGTVTVYSEPDLGSTFRVYLPASSQAAVPRTGEAGTDEEISGRGEVVLVVEDDPLTLRLTGRMLESRGYSPMSAGTTSAALRLLDMTDRVDVMLTDVVLSETSGLDLAEQVKSQRPEIKVVYMSGYPEALLARKGIATGRLLEKPFTADALVAALSEALVH